MKKAALQTDGILPDPEPYVLVTNLCDFSVTYKLMASTNDPKQVLLIETELRQKLLDLFNAEGIEIMSPSVTSIRESTSPMIPSDDDSRPFSFTGRKKKT